MQKNKDQSGEIDDLKRVLQIGAGAAGAMIAGPPGALVGVLAPELVQSAVNAVIRVRDRIANRRIGILLTEIGEAMDSKSPEDVAKYIDEHPGEEWMERALIESFKQALNLLDDAALPYVARLTAEYFTAKRKPDAYFRSVGRLLEEVEADDLALLNELLRGTEQGLKSVSGLVTVIGSIEATQLALEIRISKTDVKRIFISQNWTFDHLVRVFALLKRFALAGEGPIGTWESGPHILVVDPNRIRRLRRVFFPVSPENRAPAGTNPSQS